MITEWSAPAKLTLSLRITGVRADGSHLLESEMVSLDLADTLVIDDGTDGGVVTQDDVLDVDAEWPAGMDGWRDLSVGPTADNLVTRALEATGRSARIRLVKRVPPGAGLGGGSSDAAAVLRWARCADLEVAASLGADVPFCLGGGRALVSGIGESVTPLPFEERSFVLLLPPFGVNTAAVYRAWDRLAAEGAQGAIGTSTNDLEAAAIEVEPRLGEWRRVLEEASDRSARLAGSGSTWFVEGSAKELGLDGRAWLEHAGQRAPLVSTRTSPVVE